MARPSILFLTLYPEAGASARYRVGQFLPFLREAGFECTVLSAVSDRQYARMAGTNRRGRAAWYHLAETSRRLTQLLSARRYQIVFLQKAVMTAYLVVMPALLRMCARTLVYDIDDAVHLAPPHPLRGIWRLVESRRQVESLFASAGRVLAGNAWLAGEARRCGGQAEVFPTVVDTGRFVPGSAEDGVYRLGWIGNPSTTPSLGELGTDFLTGFSGEVLLMGADPGRTPWPEAEIVPWSLETEVETIQQFSVGLMPLPKTEWSRGKCALKALQYMACGVPCVATPHGAVCDIIRPGENGLLADSPEEWREAIERLRNPALRRRLGEAGRATVEKEFALERWAPRLCRLLEMLI